MLLKKTIIWLSEKQRELDNYISDKKKLKINEEIMNKKIVAFFVELGEYANEERSFKYWSEKAPSALEIQLDEYIDCLHFILSIGNQINFNFESIELKNLDINNNIECYFKIIENLSKFNTIKSKDNYFNLINSFLFIIDLKNYSEEEIINAYNIKNKINFERQNSNY